MKFHDLKNITKLKKILLLCLICITIFSCFIFKKIEYFNELKNIGQNQDEKYKDFLQKLQTLVQLRMQHDNLEQEYIELSKKLLPIKFEKSYVTDILLKQANLLKIDIESFNLDLPEKDYAFYKAYTLNLKLRSHYQQLSSFIINLSYLDFIVRIQELTLEKNNIENEQDATLLLKLKLEIYELMNISGN